MTATNKPSDQPKLYTFFRSSAAFRVRIALNIKAIAWTPEYVSLIAGEQKSAEYVALNPQALVPTFMTNGQALNQSLAIMEYLDDLQPEPALLPKSAFERAQVRSLAQLIACEIHPLNNLRVLKHLRQSFQLDEDGINTWYRHWCDEGLAALERQLTMNSNSAGHGGRYTFGDSVGLADCCLVPQIFNAQRYQVNLTPFPRTMLAFDACMKLPAFADAVPMKQPDAV
jgi:maleylpyruvate isomerase